MSALNQELLSRTIEGVSKDEIEAHFSLLPNATSSTPVPMRCPVSAHGEPLAQLNTGRRFGRRPLPHHRPRDDRDQNMTVVKRCHLGPCRTLLQAGRRTDTSRSKHSQQLAAISRSDHISIDTFYIMDPDGDREQYPESI